MKVDALIKWFMPKEERFRELFARDSANLLRACRAFEEFVEADALDVRRVKMAELKDREHEGDSLTRQIFEALNSSFITPFDREDIREIATDLDDVLDSVESAAQHVILFELGNSPEGLRQFADILVQMGEECDRITQQMWNQANEKEINERIVRVSDLENRADLLYNTLIADLFRGANGRDPLEILKWKEVYEGLETACDQFKDYTHVVGNVLVKNA
jgi:predicted phosphate transport protein (TIGR00153 family)